MEKSIKKQVLVNIKTHIGYIVCGNGKHYDIFKEGDRFGFYSQSGDKKSAGVFRIFDKIGDVFSEISYHNDGYNVFYFN